MVVGLKTLDTSLYTLILSLIITLFSTYFVFIAQFPYSTRGNLDWGTICSAHVRVCLKLIFWLCIVVMYLRETRTGQQVAQLHDRYMMMMCLQNFHT